MRLANLSLEVFDIIDYYSYSKFKKFKSVKLESRTVKDIKNSSTSLESSIYSDQESSLSHHSSLDLSNPSPTYISSDITALWYFAHFHTHIHHQHCQCVKSFIHSTHLMFELMPKVKLLFIWKKKTSKLFQKKLFKI